MNQQEMEARVQKVLAPIADRPAGYARLGKGNGSGVIIADAANRMAYIFDTNIASQAKLAQDLFISGIDNKANEGKRVRLGYPTYEPDRLHILGMDSGEGMTSLGGISLNEQRTTATQYPDVGKILNFRLKANEPADLNVFLGPSGYYDLSGLWHWFGGDTLDTDFTTTIAALSSQHQMAVVYFDVTTGLMGFVTVTAVSGGQADKAYFDGASIEGLSFSAGQILVGAVHLYAGQTAIVEADFYREFDPRVVFPTPGSTGGGGGTEDLTARKRSWMGI